MRPACVGVDYLSVGGHKANGSEVHGALLGAGILVIEGLDLSAAEPGDYELLVPSAEHRGRRSGAREGGVASTLVERPLPDRT